MEDPSICVAVFDSAGCRCGLLDEDTAITLIAVASEDPLDWDEMMAYWPRYTTRVVPEFASNLPLEIAKREETIDALRESVGWVVLDLTQKKIVTCKTFHEITRDACFAMHINENGKQQDPLSVHLAPWWELHEQVDLDIVDVVDQVRQSPINVPVVDRNVLFGKPLIEDIASRVLAIADSEEGQQAFGLANSDVDSNRDPFYQLTIEVHRQWLMTPRADLDGMYPRQMLHGGRDWLEKLVAGQRMRFERGGGSLVASPTDVVGYLNGPIGREEMAMYFDLCRELISAAWFWCKNQADLNLETKSETPQPVKNQASDLTRSDLAAFLTDVKTQWWADPFEGGSPPKFIIECSRRRVPRGAGVEIVGMSERQSEQHIIDCDCPICNMSADGMFGPSFAFIDGHRLELDDEFAFSMHEKREDWKAQQEEFAQLSARWDREDRERSETADRQDSDEFESVWNSGNTTDQPFPASLGGDTGNLRLAFLLAEIISELQQFGAPEELIRRLNTDFSAYRQSEPVDLPDSTKLLTEALESAAEQFPDLVARVASFQSRLSERLRTPVANSKDDWDDMPF